MTQPNDPDLFEWWRDPMCHFGDVQASASFLVDRSSVAPALEFMTRELHLRRDSKVLDLCCGPGRYLADLALAGFDVVGMDVNPAYVHVARELLESAGATAEVNVGDMRRIPFRSQFDAVINIGTSFGFFNAEDDDQRVLQAVAAALKPGGRFLLELRNREFILKNFAASSVSTNPVQGRTEVHRYFDYARSRVEARFTRTATDNSVKHWKHSWRAYTAKELIAMLTAAGLELRRLTGDWQGNSYDVDCPRMILLAENPQA